MRGAHSSLTPRLPEGTPLLWSCAAGPVARVSSRRPEAQTVGGLTGKDSAGRPCRRRRDTTVSRSPRGARGPRGSRASAGPFSSAGVMGRRTGGLCSTVAGHKSPAAEGAGPEDAGRSQPRGLAQLGPPDDFPEEGVTLVCAALASRRVKLLGRQGGPREAPTSPWCLSRAGWALGAGAAAPPRVLPEGGSPSVRAGTPLGTRRARAGDPEPPSASMELQASCELPAPFITGLGTSAVSGGWVPRNSRGSLNLPPGRAPRPTRCGVKMLKPWPREPASRACCGHRALAGGSRR